MPSAPIPDEMRLYAIIAFCGYYKDIISGENVRMMLLDEMLIFCNGYRCKSLGKRCV